MVEIDHIRDPQYANGQLQLSDLNIAAALLSLSGAAWDGQGAPLYRPEQHDPEYQRWFSSLDRPEYRQMAVELDSHRPGVVNLPVVRTDGYTAPDGKRYKLGEIAPFNRIVYSLVGEYRYRTHGRVTRRVSWNKDDWQYWLTQWFTPGGLLSGARTLAEQRNKLLDLNRREYGIKSQLSAAGGA